MRRLTPRLPALPPRARRALTWGARALPLLGVAGMVAALREVPRVHVLPALVAVLAWTAAAYGAGAVRWWQISGRDLPLRWYARTTAEGELLGLLTPQHAGALWWRARRLRAAGADTGGAVAELAADRVCNAATVVAALLVAGSRLPLAERAAAYALVALAGAALALTRARWRHRLPDARPRRVAAWLLTSLAVQAGYAVAVLAAVAAVGLHLPATGVVGVLAAAQVASLLPGVHGAGAKEGVLAGGLVTLGAHAAPAVGAVGLLAALVWVPALLLGGGGFALRALRR